MKLNSILYVFLSVVSLASATEDGTIRGGTLTIDSYVDDRRDLKEVKKVSSKKHEDKKDEKKDGSSTDSDKKDDSSTDSDKKSEKESPTKN